MKFFFHVLFSCTNVLATHTIPFISDFFFGNLLMLIFPKFTLQENLNICL